MALGMRCVCASNRTRRSLQDVAEIHVEGVRGTASNTEETERCRVLCNKSVRSTMYSVRNRQMRVNYDDDASSAETLRSLMSGRISWRASSPKAIRNQSAALRASSILSVPLRSSCLFGTLGIQNNLSISLD